MMAGGIGADTTALRRRPLAGYDTLVASGSAPPGTTMRRRHHRPWWAVMAGLSMLLITPVVDAHPHVYVEQSIDVRFGASGLEGLRLAWEFDTTFSRLFLQTFDGDRDGRLSDAEVRKATEEQRVKLEAYGYFIDVRLDDASISKSSVEDFSIRMRGDRVYYSFTVDLRASPKGQGRLEVHVADPTNYAWFVLKAGGVTVTNASAAYSVECIHAKLARGRVLDGVRCEYRRRGP
jgi:ABC-type uncharacterized transport system substrate-binding protein